MAREPSTDPSFRRVTASPPRTVGQHFENHGPSELFDWGFATAHYLATSEDPAEHVRELAGELATPFLVTGTGLHLGTRMTSCPL